MAKTYDQQKIESCLSDLIRVKNTLHDIARLMSMEGQDYHSVQYLTNQLDDHLREMAQLLFPGDFDAEFGEVVWPKR